MGRTARSCLQSLMKAMNLIMGMVGIAMILYAVWMARVWQRDSQDSSSHHHHHHHSPSPWFIYTFLGIGVTFCLITCLGHIAAGTANCFCLCCYMAILCLVLLLETAMAADIVLNSDWEKDLPEDPTGRFHDFKEFVESNLDVFKWIGLLIILAQGTAILLGMSLRALGPNQASDYDSDDEYTHSRVPLINPQVHQPPAYVIGDPRFVFKNDDPVKPAPFGWNANK
ncbi:hypothetical protein LWI28_015325 [Acer negundo]|uniref:Tetraspanin n=1 Tax=Acer negundo TaxID=4023 RepID=A0AAD5P5D1_ACENE|nr:hypothetical protein LWI28_015325 [Acer negundo]KAK4858102.1 hypothetical protein QYF36_011108 [Acer negundo]